MKQKMVKLARQALPHKTLQGVEETYRRTRSKLVSARYGHPAKTLKVIAITGTNGKTTTACYINEILKEAGKTTALFSTALIEIAGERKPNDLNVTVATTGRMQRFFRAAKRAKADYVIIEATSHALHQHKLDGIPIEAAVMTNLTQDHLDYHGSMEAYAKAKALLFEKSPKFIVLNRDDEWFDYYDKYTAYGQKITYGKHEDAEAHITRTKLFKKGTEVSLTIDHQTKLEMATALPGEFNAYNMVAAAALGYLLELKLDDIIEGAANLEEIPGRFERAVEGQPYDVIVDYAHTPDALEKMLTTVKQLAKNRIILVFGATGDRDREKRPIMGEIAAHHADRIIVTDEESYNEDPSTIRDMVMDGIKRASGEGKTTEIADRRDAIKKGLSIAKKGDLVLITGMGHEKFRIVGGKRLPWNDTEVVKELLEKEKE